MAKLFSGSSDDIIKENQRMLCNEGMSEAQATHLALKHAHKDKAVNRSKKGVMAKPRADKVKVKK